MLLERLSGMRMRREQRLRSGLRRQRGCGIPVKNQYRESDDMK
jgi:hypothetical protein